MARLPASNHESPLAAAPICGNNHLAHPDRSDGLMVTACGAPSVGGAPLPFDRRCHHRPSVPESEDGVLIRLIIEWGYDRRSPRSCLHDLINGARSPYEPRW
jgi:hypothetical protein